MASLSLDAAQSELERDERAGDEQEQRTELRGLVTIHAPESSSQQADVMKPSC